MPTHFSSNKPHDNLDWKVLQTALRAAEEGVYCWDIKQGHISYTEQCMKMLGMSFHETAPNIFTEPEVVIHEQDLNFFKAELQRYLGWITSTPMRLEIRLRNMRSRAWRWIRVNGLVERDEQHQPARLVGVWIDITRRKMSDRLANEDRELFRTLINYLPDSIYFKNKESRFVVANTATAQKMGVPTPSDLIGSTDRNFFEDSMSSISRREELAIMNTRRPIIARLHSEPWKDTATKTKGRTYSQISKFPWLDGQGEVRGIVGISSDVTKLVETRKQYQALATQLDERNKALENEINLAREIQQALQPLSIPSRKLYIDAQCRSAHFHHIYLPSTGVAGDCFAVFPVGESGTGMLICDVMGHGIRAALIASMLRGLMEQVADLADSPARLLSSLNRVLCRIFNQANISMFASACYVYLDLEGRRLTLSSAGHPAPIVIDSENRAFTPSLPRATALGIVDTAIYREAEIELESGMKLMLYTDGLTEAKNEYDDELGCSRLLDYHNEHPPESIQQMLSNSLDTMHQFAGMTPIDDDICILGVSFEEESLN